MRGEAMTRLIQRFEEEYPLNEMVALEFFAREGDWQTKVFYEKCKKLYAWEIDPAFEANLRKNLPQAEIFIGDSYALAKKSEFRNLFNFIVLDNPQNCFGLKNQYTEHFEALPLVPNLLAVGKNNIVIFNINTQPFNYDQFPDWQRKRNEFYKLKDTSHLEIDHLKEFYKNFFNERGLKVKKLETERRGADYLHYMVCHIEKI